MVRLPHTADREELAAPADGLEDMLVVLLTMAATDWVPVEAKGRQPTDLRGGRAVAMAPHLEVQHMVASFSYHCSVDPVVVEGVRITRAVVAVAVARFA